MRKYKVYPISRRSAEDIWKQSSRGRRCLASSIVGLALLVIYAIRECGTSARKGFGRFPLYAYVWGVEQERRETKDSKNTGKRASTALGCAAFRLQHLVVVKKEYFSV